jgi:hypothetical protein
MSGDYFKRVAKLSPTKFWINNPTREEADLAIAAGATGCTLNPSYTQKMLDHPTEGTYALSVLEKVLAEYPDDVEAIAEFQRRMAEPICGKFMPMFEASGGEIGYVSIQGDPILEHDPEVINLRRPQEPEGVTQRVLQNSRHPIGTRGDGDADPRRHRRQRDGDLRGQPGRGLRGTLTSGSSRKARCGPSSGILTSRESTTTASTTTSPGIS